jgi:hypothetical protein
VAQPIPLAFAANKRSGFPEAVTLNVLSEPSPTKQSAPEALISRPGLEAFQQVGTAPIRGVFARSGLLSEAAFIVCSDTAYLVTSGGSITTLTGTIGGSGAVEIDGGLDADYNSVIRVATGEGLYKFVDSGTSVVSESKVATSVAFWAGYWLYAEADSDAVYYLNPTSGVWSAIDFSSAEYQPDWLAGVRVVGDLAAMLGKASTEFWSLTGVADSPMAPAGGLKFDIGCRNIAAAINCKGTLIWPADDGSVYLSEGGPPSLISDNGLAEQIRRTPSADLSASFFIVDQHPIYVLHLGTRATWAYDLSTRRWTRFASYGYDYWRARFFANVGETILATDRLSNQVYRLDPDRRLDGSDPIIKEFCAFLDVADGAADVGNIELDCETGSAAYGDDEYIGLRLSRDGSRTWGAVEHRPLGQRGDYHATPRWLALGEARAPHGMICKFETAAPVGRFSSVRANAS